MHEVIAGSKQCVACGETKALTDFYVASKRGDKVYHSPRCKPCDIQKVLDRHNKHRQEILAQQQAYRVRVNYQPQKKYRQNNREKIREYQRTYRAQKKAEKTNE